MFQNIKDKLLQAINNTTGFQKKIVTVFLSIFVLAVLFAYIFSNRLTIINYEWNISLWYIIFAVAFYLVGLCVIFIAWFNIMEKLGSINDIWTHLAVFSKSIIARRIPLPIWYIGSRLYYYDREFTSWKQIAVATYIETVLTGFSGIVALSVIEVITQKTTTSILLGIIVILFSLLVMGYPSLLINIVNRILIMVHKEPVNVDLKSQDWVIWFTLYFISWILAGVSFIFCVYAITTIRSENLVVLKISVISGLIGFLSMFLPAGFGIKEFVTGLLMGPYIPLSIGLIVSIFYRITITITEILWALVAGYISSLLTHKSY